MLFRSPEEVGPYLENRLRVAGNSRVRLAAGTHLEVHAHSGGIPRLINMLADRMLLLGFVDGLEELHAGLVREAWTNLGSSPPVRLAPPDERVSYESHL